MCDILDLSQGILLSWELTETDGPTKPHCTGQNWSRLQKNLQSGSSRVTGACTGPGYTSVLMLQLRVNMSLMVTERARLGFR